MSDGAWEKMRQCLIKSFVICRADPNDRKISIQPLKRNFESLHATPSEGARGVFKLLYSMWKM